MNAGKLVAQIAVVAIVVYFTYTAVAAAVPTDVHNMNDLFSVTDDFAVNTESIDDGMNMKITVSGAVATKLPQNLEGVYIDVFIGEKNMRTEIAHADIGAIKAKDTTVINTTSIIPTYALLAYAVNGTDAEGNITVPLVLSFGFKYMEWYGVYLVDLGMNIKQTMTVATGVGMPEKGAGDGDHSAKVKVVMDGSANELIDGVTEKLTESGMTDFTLDANGASISVKITDEGGGKTGLTINAAGAGDKSAVALLTEAIGEDGLTLKHGEDSFTITKENADAFIALITTLYTTAGVDP